MSELNRTWENLPLVPDLGQELRQKLRQTEYVKHTFRKLGQTRNIPMWTETIGLHETELSGTKGHEGRFRTAFCPKLC